MIASKSRNANVASDGARAALFDSNPFRRSSLEMVLADWFETYRLTPTTLASEADVEAAAQIDLPWAIAIFNLGGERLTGSALAVNRAIARGRPSTPRVILADSANPDFVVDALREGVCGYLSTQAELAVVKEALSLLLAGGDAACVPRSALSALATRGEPSDRGRSTLLLRKLTLRQLDVLDCIANGLSNKMIARQLHMQESTVKCNHPAETTAGGVDEAPAIRLRWLPVAVSAASSRAGGRRGG